MARNLVYEYHSDEQDSANPCVDVLPTNDGRSIIVSSFEVSGHVVKLGFGLLPSGICGHIVVERFKAGQDRNTSEPLSTYRKAIVSNDGLIDYRQTYLPYNSAQGLALLTSTGFRVTFEPEGCACGRVYLEVGTTTMSADHFS